MNVKPKTFLTGFTQAHMAGIREYLNYTRQTDFLKDWDEALASGVSSGEALCSLYAKMCYKSLVLGKNDNLTRIRDIESNIVGCYDTNHGSVFRHCNINWVTTDCTRIFTHELVRHGIGTAFSQTSGRYVAIDELVMGYRPEIDGNPEVQQRLAALAQHTAIELRWARERLFAAAEEQAKSQGLGSVPFDVKKKITSAIRAYAPNGQVNEIGWSCNIQSLRHMIVMRTYRGAEWEIRYVFNQVADIVSARWPLMMTKMSSVEVDGLKEYTTDVVN